MDDSLTNAEIVNSMAADQQLAAAVAAAAAAEEEEERQRIWKLAQESRCCCTSFFMFLYNKCCCKYIFPVLVLVGVVAAVLRGLGIQPTKDQIPFGKYIFSRNGWKDVEVDDLPRWDTGGSGFLKLEMINALDADWQDYFTQTIEDYSKSTDNSILELTVTRTAPNDNCGFERGKFVVCNGDYGASDFHGTNELLVNDGVITASLTKLNEHYMRRASKARKQYTMCHEIGHGFGLPHADENFFNLNLGNCMDYTNRPWTNTAPDTYTFELLEAMYGVSEPESAISGSPTGAVSFAKSSSSSTGSLRTANKDVSFPAGTTQRANEAAINLEAKLTDEVNDGGHRDENTAAFQVELGDGFVLHTQFLLAH